MREAARRSAQEKFSQEKFETGWEAVLGEMIRRVEERTRGIDL
jgi:hypothetical protein